MIAITDGESLASRWLDSYLMLMESGAPAGEPSDKSECFLAEPSLTSSLASYCGCQPRAPADPVYVSGLSVQLSEEMGQGSRS